MTWSYIQNSNLVFNGFLNLLYDLLSFRAGREKKKKDTEIKSSEICDW